MADGLHGTGRESFSFDSETRSTAIEDGNGTIDPRQLDGSSDGDSAGSFGSGSGEQFDPEIHVSPDKRNKDGSYRRKRGRRKGKSNSQTNSKKATDLKGSIDHLSSMLVMVHLGLASSTNIEELSIDKSEGDLLARASVDLMEQFDVTPDPKVQAIFGMIVACSTVYGPRIVTYRMRKVNEKRNKPKNEKATVYSADGKPQGETIYNEIRPNSGADNASMI